jgi:hypothetical protein
MKAFAATGLFAALMVGVGVGADLPKPPAPEKEHEWLTKMFAGTWEGEGQCFMEPGKPMKISGTETCKAIGPYWVQGEIKGDMAGQAMTGVMTVGYDVAKKKFVGTWVCSMCPNLCQYEGSLDSTGKILTLECEAPNPMNPGKNCKMRDVTEFKSDTHRVLTSSMLGDDGKWVTIMTMECKKK